MAGNPLEVTLSARLDQFERDMSRAGDIAGDAVGKIEQTFANSNPTLGGLGAAGGLAAALGVGGLIEAAVKANASLADLLRTAKDLGLTLDRIQSLQFAAKLEGIDTEKFNDGMRKMVALVSDAQEHENSLSKLYEANGLKITDNNGKLIETNKALENAVGLISRAKTEQDKIDFARMLGLTREWVPLLEKGVAALEGNAAAARAAGAVIEDSIIRKADEFDREWRKASVTFESNLKAAMIAVLPLMNQLVQGAISVGSAIAKVTGLLGDLGKESVVGFEGLNSGDLERRLERLNAAKQAASITGNDVNRQSILGITLPGRDIDAEISRTETRIAELKKQIDAPRLEVRSGAGTNRPAADTAGKDAFDRTEDSLKRRAALFEAEAKSIGLSAEAQAKARAEAELYAAAERAGLPITDELREKINALSDAYAASAEHARKAKDAFQGINDAARFFGNQLVDVFDGLLNRTTTWQQGMSQILKAFQRELLQAALTGEGAFAKLLGTNSSNGGAGGLFGSLASLFKLGGSSSGGGTILEGPAALGLTSFDGARAGGGPVSAGKTYLVGENGPEMVRFNQSGIVVPNAMIGGGPSPNFSVSVVNNAGADIGVGQPRPDGQGGYSLEVLVDQAAAKAIAKPGTASNRALRSGFGLTPSLISR